MYSNRPKKMRSRGRPRKYDFSDPATFATTAGRKALRTHIDSMKRKLCAAIDTRVRRYICFICGAMFESSEMSVSPQAYGCEQIQRCANMSHFIHLDATYPNLSAELTKPDRAGFAQFYVCNKWCMKRYSRFLNDKRQIPICESLKCLRPFNDVPEPVKDVRNIASEAWSLLDVCVNLGGGLERGHYMALKGDFLVDEDLVGCFGTVCGRIEWEEYLKVKFRRGAEAIIKDGRHDAFKKFLLVAEKFTYRIGVPILRSDVRERAHEEGRGEEINCSGVHGYVIPRREAVRLSQFRARVGQKLRAGVAYLREMGLPHAMYWDSDIEAMVFPYLYLEGYGGFIYTSSKGITWEEHIEKRIWSVNPMYRCSTLYLAFMFDIGEKLEVHRTSIRSFLPDDVADEDADHFMLMAESTSKGYESVCRRDLTRGRWGIAAASSHIGKPNVFQTETMNEKDMEELQTVACRLTRNGEMFADNVNTAYLYKVRQIEIMETLLPCTGLGNVEYGSIRLEIQSGRSYRLHAHNILLVGAREEQLFSCISASLSSMEPSYRKKHEPVARHRCLPYKCKNGECIYGYPVLEASDRTYRKKDESEDCNSDGTIVYKREVGNGIIEMDEKVTPFCVELSCVRVCHGAFMIGDDELATGYAGKYTFKCGGGLGAESGFVSLSDILRWEEVQLLRQMSESGRKQLVKEKIGTRAVSMLEICLSLCQESLVYSNFYLRELWIVLPFERKKFICDNMVRKGIPGGEHLRGYYRRSNQYDNDSFEQYYSRGDVQHCSDKERGVQIISGRGDRNVTFPEVLVHGKKKRLISRVMPIRSKGKRLIERYCWVLILRFVPHRSVDQIWDFENEEAWDAAARCGALGQSSIRLRGKSALEQAASLANRIEMEFSAKMGRNSSQKEMEKAHFEEAIDAVVRDCYGPESAMNDQSNVAHLEIVSERDELDRVTQSNQHEVVEKETNVEKPVTNTYNVLDLPGYRSESSERAGFGDEIVAWRDRFKRKGWVINDKAVIPSGDEHPTDRAIIDLPDNVKKILRTMKAYPSQLATCLEIIDSIVRCPWGLRRFVSGSAGRGKSYVKKCVARILRKAGLTVRVLAVAESVAQDDDDGQGCTIASAFNSFTNGAQIYDNLAYEHAKVDVFIIDEVSMLGIRQARLMINYLARGAYMRAGGAELSVEARESRFVTSSRNSGDDPWFGCNIIMFGDLMQLDSAECDSLFTSERLWGDIFRHNTLILEENVRSTDERLLRFAERLRNYGSHAYATDTMEIIDTVKERTVESMLRTPLGCTVLSPRFHRAVEFCNLGLVSADDRPSERDALKWSKEIYTVKCDDYVSGNRTISIDQCLGMDNEGALEGKRSLLDRDHTRVRNFSFRVGMNAVVSENGVNTGTDSGVGRGEEPKWPGLPINSEVKQVSNRTFCKQPRLLNGEREKIEGIVESGGEVIGVKVSSVGERWKGIRTIKKTVSKSEVLKRRSFMEGRTLRFKLKGVEKSGKVTRRQVALILELALTVHKSQGMTLETS